MTVSPPDMYETRCSDAERLIRKLTSVQAYVLSDFDAPTDADTLGWGSGQLDTALRHVLEKTGRWQGRRPAMVLNFRAIDQMATDRVEPKNVASEARLLADLVAVHECSHILRMPPPYHGPNVGIVEEIVLSRVLLKRAAEHKVPEPGSIEATLAATLPSWHSHGPKFWRIGLHLLNRYRQFSGQSVPPCMLCILNQHGLPPASAIERLLGGEPHNLRRLSFESIKRKSPPKPFRKFWIEQFRLAKAGKAQRNATL